MAIDGRCEDGVVGVEVAVSEASIPFTARNAAEQSHIANTPSSPAKYVRELIRRDQDRQHLRSLLEDGARSTLGPAADDAYLAGLRNRICAAG